MGKCTAEPVSLRERQQTQEESVAFFAEKQFEKSAACGQKPSQKRPFAAAQPQEPKPKAKRRARTGENAKNAAVEDALLRKATGYCYAQQESCRVKNTEYAENGKKLRETEDVRVVEVEKYVQPDFSAIALWLKSRLPQKWGEAAAEAPPQVVRIVDDIPAQSEPLC